MRCREDDGKYSLYEEENIGWEVHDGWTVPITVSCGIVGLSRDWAIRWLDGTYWIPEVGIFKTKEEVLTELLKQQEERKERRGADA
jgi:hypothetical protein